MSDEEGIQENVTSLLDVLARAHTAWVKSKRLSDGTGNEAESIRRVATYITLRAMMNTFRVTEVPEETAAQIDEYADDIELETKRVAEAWAS